MTPKYQYHVFVCQNQREQGHSRGCCLSKGSDGIANYLRIRIKALGLKSIRINKAGCLNQCEKGPAVVVYPEGIWYKLSSIDEAEQFIQLHLIAGTTVDTLIMS